MCACDYERVYTHVYTHVCKHISIRMYLNISMHMSTYSSEDLWFKSRLSLSGKLQANGIKVLTPTAFNALSCVECAIRGFKPAALNEIKNSGIRIGFDNPLQLLS